MIIITRPEHDLTTKYISLWAEEIISLAKKKGIDIIDLNKQKANKKEFEGRVKKLSPKMIFINGHGDDNCVAGHNNEILIEADKNHDVLEGRIIYALSCRSGKKLGQKILSFSNSAYIGYLDDFVIIMDSDYAFKPLKDPKARPFMEASNQVMISLLKGNNAGEASSKSKEKFRLNYGKLLSSNTDSGSLLIAQMLWWNEKHQICIGDSAAVLV